MYCNITQSNKAWLDFKWSEGTVKELAWRCCLGLGFHQNRGSISAKAVTAAALSLALHFKNLWVWQREPASPLQRCQVAPAPEQRPKLSTCDQEVQHGTRPATTCDAKIHRDTKQTGTAASARLINRITAAGFSAPHTRRHAFCSGGNGEDVRRGLLFIFKKPFVFRVSGEKEEVEQNIAGYFFPFCFA